MKPACLRDDPVPILRPFRNNFLEISPRSPSFFEIRTPGRFCHIRSV